MNRKYAAIFAACVSGALAAAGGALSQRTSMPTLKGVVGPGYTISLKKGTTKVRTLKTGTYKLVITDKSAIHNFTLEREKPSRPKIEKHITSTLFKGTKTVVMTLKPGSWRAYCSVHEALMHIDFKVKR